MRVWLHASRPAKAIDDAVYRGPSHLKDVRDVLVGPAPGQVVINDALPKIIRSRVAHAEVDQATALAATAFALAQGPKAPAAAGSLLSSAAIGRQREGAVSARRHKTAPSLCVPRGRCLSPGGGEDGL